MANYRFHFQALMTKVNPSSDRISLTKDLPGDVRDWLKEHEYETASPHSRLTGSYARSTAILDIKDVDVLLFLPPEITERTPESILRELRQILEDYPGGFAETAPQRRSIRLELPEHSLHLDIVPVVAPDGIANPLQIPDRRQQVWIDTDPLGYAKRLTEVNIANGRKVIPLIKLMKVWRDIHLPTRRVKSYALEVMVLHAVESGGISLERKGLAQGFAELTRHLHSKYSHLFDDGAESPRVADPQTGKIITGGWGRPSFETFMRRLSTTAAAAERAIEADDAEDGISEWQVVFGEFWPAPEEVKTAARSEAATIAPGRTGIGSSGQVVGTYAPVVVSRPTKFHGGNA